MTNFRTTIIRRTAAVAFAVTAVGGLGACGTSIKGVKAATSTTAPAATTDAPTTTNPSDTPPATTTAAAATTQPSNNNNSSNTNSSGNGGGSNGHSSSGGSTSTGPTIASFTTPDNIDCHNGNFQNFTVSWSTQGASKVTISIDGSGIYDTYGPSGSTSLPFNCSTSHTFLLRAYAADGSMAQKSVTLQPRNAQMTTTTTMPGDGDQP